jgi:hypothetical protein
MLEHELGGWRVWQGKPNGASGPQREEVSRSAEGPELKLLDCWKKAARFGGSCGRMVAVKEELSCKRVYASSHLSSYFSRILKSYIARSRSTTQNSSFFIPGILVTLIFHDSIARSESKS